MIFELAGIVGVDPGPLSLRELIWMADAAVMERWDRHAVLLHLLTSLSGNVRRVPPPEEFHLPLQQRRAAAARSQPKMTMREYAEAMGYRRPSPPDPSPEPSPEPQKEHTP